MWQMEEIKVISTEIDEVLSKFEGVFEMPTELPPQRINDH